MSAGNTIKWIIVIDDSQVKGKISTLNSNLATVGNTANTAGSKMKTFNAGVTTIGTGVDKANKTVLTSTKNIGAMGRSAAQSVKGVGSFASSILSLAGIDTGPLDDVLRVVSSFPMSLGKVTTSVAKFSGTFTKQFQTIKGAIDPVSNALGGTGGKGTGGMSGALANISTNAPAASKGFGTLGKGAKSLMFSLGPIGLAFAAIGIAMTLIATNAGGIQDKLNAMGKAIGDAVPAMRPFLDVLNGIAGLLGLTDSKVDLGKALGTLGTQITSAFANIQKTVNAFVLDPIGMMTNFVTAIGTWLAKNGPKIVSAFANFVKPLLIAAVIWGGGMVTALIAGLKKTIDGATKSIVTAFTNFVKTAIVTATALGKGVWDAFQKALSTAVNGATSALKKIGGKIWSGIISGLGNLWNAIVDKAGIAAGALKGALKWAGVPGFQYGKDMVVTKPTLFLAGEEPGQPERIQVTPTNRFAGQRGFVGGVEMPQMVGGAPGTMFVEVHTHVMDREIVRRFKGQMGRGRAKFG